jgi:hypothetical protein
MVLYQYGSSGALKNSGCFSETDVWLMINESLVTIVKFIISHLFCSMKTNTKLPTPNQLHTTEKASFWEADSHSASQEILRLLWRLQSFVTVFKSFI